MVEGLDPFDRCNSCQMLQQRNVSYIYMSNLLSIDDMLLHGQS